MAQNLSDDANDIAAFWKREKRKGSEYKPDRLATWVILVGHDRNLSWCGLASYVHIPRQGRSALLLLFLRLLGVERVGLFCRTTQWHAAPRPTAPERQYGCHLLGRGGRSGRGAR